MTRLSALTDLGLLYCAAIWGSTFYLVKDALDDVDPIVMVAYRFIFAASLLGPIAGRRPKMGVHIKESLVLAGLLWALYVSQTVGLAYTSASNSGFITGLFIVFVPVFLWLFFSKPPTKAQ